MVSGLPVLPTQRKCHTLTLLLPVCFVETSPAAMFRADPERYGEGDTGADAILRALEDNNPCAAVFDVDVACNGITETITLSPGSGRAVGLSRGSGGIPCRMEGDCRINRSSRRPLRRLVPANDYGVTVGPNLAAGNIALPAFRPGDFCAIYRDYPSSCMEVPMHPYDAALHDRCRPVVAKILCNGAVEQHLFGRSGGHRRLNQCFNEGDCRLLDVASM